MKLKYRCGDAFKSGLGTSKKKELIRNKNSNFNDIFSN